MNESKATRTLVILSNLEDFTADYFIAHLEQRGRGYLRLNSEEAAEWRFVCEISRTRRSLSLNFRGRSIRSSDSMSVWFRRVVRPRPSTAVQDQYAHFVGGEISDLLGGVLETGPALWVNAPRATFRAELKVFQLAIAHELGANIPDTLIANEPDHLLDFAATHPKIITKPLHSGFLSKGNDTCAIYTSRVGRGELMEYASDLGHYPTLLQEEVERGLDYRVTLIGHEAFVAEVHMGQNHVDWRHPGEATTFSRGNAPESVIEFCRKMNERLSLKFAAYDFIRAPNGEWYFLELNPAGEWAWLERELHFPMRSSLERLLYEEATQ